MALSDDALWQIIDAVPGCEERGDGGAWLVSVLRAVEAEVHKQDNALILQLVEALGVATTPISKDRQEVLRALAAGRARLEGKP